MYMDTEELSNNKIQGAALIEATAARFYKECSIHSKSSMRKLLQKCIRVAKDSPIGK